MENNTENKIEQNKQTFLSLVQKYVKRDGIQNLVDWLERTNFFHDPASTKYHSNFEGGLCEHSLNVYNRLVRLLQFEYGDDWQKYCSMESAVIIGLFHDICKTDTYKIDQRNVKENGMWVQKPYYMTNDTLPYGHGEKSVYIINGFMRLTREEAMCINWHMGEYDLRVKAGQSLTNIYYQYPLVLLTHIADNTASYLDETITN